MRIKKTNHPYLKHPLYAVWRKIKDRLYNPNHEAYKHYGGKGVVMCDEWKNNPSSFIEWALGNGWRNGLHIDKDKIPHHLGIDANIYSPDMCSILTPAENNRYLSRNTYVEYNGKTQTVMDWANEYKIDYATLHHRLFDYGYTPDEAFNLPIRYNKSARRVEYNGHLKTIGEIARENGVKHATMYYRIDKLGLSINDAINFKDGNKRKRK